MWSSARTARSYPCSTSRPEKVAQYDDTHFTAKIEVNPSGTFYGWIFKFKGKIKILSPKECITEMQQIAQEFI